MGQKGQQESATCVGANCVGGDLILAPGKGTIGGEMLLETGGVDGDGDTRIKINDTQNYIYDNTDFDSNLTLGDGQYIFGTDATQYFKFNSTGVTIQA